MVANFRCRRSDQSSQGGDEFSGFIQIGGSVFGKPALHCSGAHEVNASCVDNLYRGNFRDITR